MIQSGPHSRWRRLAMQGLLSLLLLGVVALAALVTRQRQLGLRVPLDRVQSFGNLQLRLPAGWQISAAGEQEAPLVVQARERSDADDPALPPRRIFILRDRRSAFLSPSQYLLEEKLFTHFNPAAPPVRQTVAGFPGLLIQQLRLCRDGEDEFVTKCLLACTVLPSREVLVVGLEGLGPVTPSDKALIRQVAESLVLASPGISQLAPEGMLELPGGIRFARPKSFRPVHENDPNSIQRHLFLDAADAWAAAELIPIVFPSPNRAQTLLTLLCQHDTAWRSAVIHQLTPASWRIDPPAGDHFPLRAYALAGVNGQGLLVIFHGDCDPAVSRFFEPAWQQLAASVQFTGKNDFAELEKTGIEEVRRLSGMGLTQLIGQDREPQWWLWYNENPAHHIGWSHLRFTDPTQWRCRREARWRSRQGHPSQLIQQWSGNDDLQTYTSLLTLPDGLDRSWALSFGVLAVSLPVAQGSTLPVSHPAPPNYIPGGWLPLFMGRLSARPMAIQSEWFLDQENLASPEPFTLILRPTPNSRTLTVQINGFGELTRWHFAADGSVEEIDFPAGLHHVRTNLTNLRIAFQDDQRIKP